MRSRVQPMRKPFTRRQFMSVASLAAAGAALQACAPSVAEPTPARSAAAPPTPVPVQPAATQPLVAPTAQTAAQPVAATAAVATKPARFVEAPMLAPLVQSGSLPAIEKRLPPEPLVLQPKDEPGEYSDKFVWATASQTLEDARMYNGNENFLRWTRDTQGFRPNVLASFDWNQDATALTMHMRKGIRWSDLQRLHLLVAGPGPGSDGQVRAASRVFA